MDVHIIYVGVQSQRVTTGDKSYVVQRMSIVQYTLSRICQPLQIISTRFAALCIFDLVQPTWYYIISGIHHISSNGVGDASCLCVRRCQGEGAGQIIGVPTRYGLCPHHVPILDGRASLLSSYPGEKQHISEYFSIRIRSRLFVIDLVVVEFTPDYRDLQEC